MRFFVVYRAGTWHKSLTRSTTGAIGSNDPPKGSHMGNTAKLYTVRGMSKPQSKKDTSKPYAFAFVFPAHMGDDFTAARVKGTGKPATLPAGMSLVWSITHDGWRTFNLGGCTELQSFDFDTDLFDNVCEGHKAALAAMNDEQRAVWNLSK